MSVKALNEVIRVSPLSAGVETYGCSVATGLGEFSPSDGQDI